MENEFPQWMKDESIQDIPKEKLIFLNQIFHDPAMHNQKNMLLQLPKLLKKARQENLLFTQDEFGRAISAIRKYCTKEELDKIDYILKNQTGNKPS